MNDMIILRYKSIKTGLPPVLSEEVMTAMRYVRITIETRGHVFLMGLNRPEKRNAFDLEMYEELTSAYGELDRNPELRCGVLFAHGDHFKY